MTHASPFSGKKGSVSQAGALIKNIPNEEKAALQEVANRSIPRHPSPQGGGLSGPIADRLFYSCPALR
jgi:hypothetical protein